VLLLLLNCACTEQQASLQMQAVEKRDSSCRLQLKQQPPKHTEATTKQAQQTTKM
jgi:hypothetical protein